MRCIAPSATQIILVGILLVYLERLDGFILQCPASNINCRTNTNSPRYDNVRIQETIGNSIEFLRSSILKLWSRLTQSNPHEYLDEMGSHENLLKKLYKSSNVLQVAPKAKINKNEEIQKLEVQKDLTIEIAKISENKEKTHELEIQKEVATEISEHSGEFSMRSKSPLKWLKKHQKTIQEDHELGKKQIGEELYLSFLKKRQQFAESIQKLQGEQVKTTSYTMIQERWKPARQQAIQKVKEWPPVTPKAKKTERKKKSRELEVQKDVATEISEALKVKRWPNHQFNPETSVHSLRKCSILHLSTQLPALTPSIVVDDDGEEQPDKVVFILKSGNRSARPSHVVISKQPKEKNTQNEQITDKLLEEEPEKEQESRKENLLRHLIGGSNSRIPTQESETFNQLLPDKTLSNKAHWEYQEQTTSVPLLPTSDFWSSNDNYFLQGDVFEAEVQKQLAHLILNEPMRNLIAHLIRMIKVNCRELTIQKPCGFFIARIGLAMKLLNERNIIQEASALKSYLLLNKNETNKTIASSRKMEKPSDEIPKQGILQYGNDINWWLAVSLTMEMVILIICLIKIYSHRTAKGTEGTCCVVNRSSPSGPHMEQELEPF